MTHLPRWDLEIKGVHLVGPLKMAEEGKLKRKVDLLWASELICFEMTHIFVLFSLPERISPKKTNKLVVYH